VNAKEDNGWTPLHYCAREGHLEVARFLIKAGSIGFAKFHRELLWYSTTGTIIYVLLLLAHASISIYI
jgi:ankyrin repeat protein